MNVNGGVIKWTLLDDNGREVICSVAATDLGIPSHIIRNDIKHRAAQNYNAIRSIRCMMEKDKFCFKNRKEYKTKYGMLTCREIYERHPFKHNMNVRLIRRRLNRRGGMCESLWWDVLPSKVMIKRLKEEGLYTEPKPKKKKKRTYTGFTPVITFDKSTTCFKNGKCVHYHQLLDDVNYKRTLPSKCSHVVDNKCKNYTTEV